MFLNLWTPYIHYYCKFRQVTSYLYSAVIISYFLLEYVNIVKKRYDIIPYSIWKWKAVASYSNYLSNSVRPCCTLPHTNLLCLLYIQVIPETHQGSHMPKTKRKNATHMLFIKPATIPVRITLNEIRMILKVNVQYSPCSCIISI